MNKILYSAAAMAAMTAMVSCSSDEPGAIGNNDAVTFKIEVPGNLATRATFGDESTVTLDNLEWTVYDMTDAAAPKAVFSGQKVNAFQSSQTSEMVSLQLVKGAKYQVVFFADNSKNSFVSFSEGDINVNYSQMPSNDADQDAFIGKSGEFTVGNDGYSETVTLTRPFAQLNWGTDDIDAQSVQAILNNLTASVSVTSGLYSKMNILSETLSDQVTEEVKFANIAMNNLPSETFPKVHDFKVYDLVAMNYLLTGEGTIACKLNFSNNISVDVNNAPVNRNYRTNIYGSLITAPGSFNIIIDNKFDTPDFNVVVKNSEEFMEAITGGSNVTIPENTTVDISNEGEIKLKDGQNIKVEGVLQTTRQQIGISGEGNTATVEGPGTIVAVGPKGSRPLNVYDGATLNVKNITVNSTQNNGGSTIYSDKGNLILNGVKSLVNSNFVIGANGGSLEATNCVFNTDSNNQVGSWSYAVGINDGCQAVFDNVDVNGIQGGVSVGGAAADGTNAHLIIKSGTYKTTPLAGANGQTAFYPVYVFDNGEVEIQGGNFISGCGYTVYDGDNDVNKPFAHYIRIKGGKFNKPSYSQKTKEEIPAADGFEWKAINEAPFTLTVVEKK